MTAATHALGQLTGNFPPPEELPLVQASRATGTIRIDGKLDEADWQHGPVIDDFFRQEPRQGGTTRYRTEVRVRFDERNLYVGANRLRLHRRIRHPLQNAALRAARLEGLALPATNANVRGSWEYQPLSFVYLVFNDRRFEDEFTPVPFAERQFVSKVTLLRQL